MCIMSAKSWNVTSQHIIIHVIDDGTRYVRRLFYTALAHNRRTIAASKLYKQ